MTMKGAMTNYRMMGATMKITMMEAIVMSYQAMVVTMTKVLVEETVVTTSCQEIITMTKIPAATMTHSIIMK